MEIRKLVFSILTVITTSLAVAQDQPNLPDINPWLTDSVYPTSHHNPAQTDASPLDGPTNGRVLSAKDVSFSHQMFNSQPVVMKMGDEKIIISSGVSGISKIRATDGAFEEISFLPYPGFEKVAAKATPKAIDALIKKLDVARRAHDDKAILELSAEASRLGFDFRTVANGVYHMVDHEGFHYNVFGGVYVLKVTDGGDANAPLRIVKSINITDALPEDLRKTVSRMVGIGMTYEGHLVAAAPGVIALLDRDLKVLDVATFPGEFVDNSIAIDKGGIFVATSENMYKLVWTGKKLSFKEDDGGWKSPYDTVDAKTALAMGSASRGSGTTPALMGFGDDEDQLVLISDADKDGAKLVAFWRNDIPKDFKQIPGSLSRRIAGSIPMGISKITAETSPVVKGYGALLINGAYPEPSSTPGDIFGNMFTGGITRLAPRGVEKYQWDPKANQWSSSWVDYNVDNSDWMVPVVTNNNIILTPSKTGLRYEYIGLNWETGKLVGRWPMPDDCAKWNLSLGIAYLLQGGDLLVGGYFGSKRIELSGD